MAQQNIDVGLNANDGLGDSIRSAGIKINANFSELYQDVSGLQTITLDDVLTNGATTAQDINSTGTITADSFSSGGTGTPTISSLTSILLDAADYIEAAAPFKAVGLTTTERNALVPQEGFIILNTTDNKFQGYVNSTWVDLH
jgi:hypothetical protein